MENQSVSIHLELVLAGESLTGRARDNSGTTREFSGRLGLLAAIDALIAGPTPGPQTSSKSD